MCHTFLLYSSVDGHIGCLHVMDIVNSTEMNTGVHVTFPMTTFSKYIPRRGTDGPYGSSVFIFLRNFCVHASVLTLCVWLFVNLWTVVHQVPEHWSGLPCPPPGDFPDPGIKPASLTSSELAGRFFTTETTWEAQGISILFSIVAAPI